MSSFSAISRALTLLAWVLGRRLSVSGSCVDLVQRRTRWIIRVVIWAVIFVVSVVAVVKMTIAGVDPKAAVAAVAGCEALAVAAVARFAGSDAATA